MCQVDSKLKYHDRNRVGLPTDHKSPNKKLLYSGQYMDVPKSGIISSFASSFSIQANHISITRPHLQIFFPRFPVLCMHESAGGITSFHNLHFPQQKVGLRKIYSRSTHNTLFLCLIYMRTRRHANFWACVSFAGAHAFGATEMGTKFSLGSRQKHRAHNVFSVYIFAYALTLTSLSPCVLSQEVCT